ncbi:HlyD family efflux transporter periplasmic adaptor subunit [Undibacterium sp. CY7W]|uniref:HlyD family efflux transporter periplasmic adaptor subunit n=1 Tax=Undibacterium rugosum TaxID=2762291 RepID=A0A923HYJ1_9BURK|nr:HlyD family efflux transporter periplasmic adaptor subunit [Undibacterium rugosum]MBC3934336.1 HlyD family efflux transporter periplasmic adaptor subunit [Undibacterium rugosum]
MVLNQQHISPQADDAKVSKGSAPTASPAATPLFRRQAIEHISNRKYGTVLLAHPLSHRFLTLLFVSIAALIIGFFVFFSTTRKAQCSGVLLPNLGVIRVLPTQAGVVLSRQVVEGQAVHAGDVLFVLSSERSAAVGDAQKTISSLLMNRRDSFHTDQSQLLAQSRARLEALRRRASDLENEIAKIDAQILLQKQRVQLAEQSFKRYVDLQATNYISAAQLQDKQAELIDQQQRLAELNRIKSANGRDLTSAHADIADLQLQSQRDAAAVQRNVSSIEQDLTENEARRELVVRAPQDGTVTAITAAVGQTVTPSIALASLIPAGSQLEAEIYAPSRSAGFVQPGMQVLLRYQAYPYQKFGQYKATVREVASNALRPEELPLGAQSANSNEALYRIRVTLDQQNVTAYGRQLPLKSGMAVDASILLEQRRLYEWVLEPLYSITGRL